MQQLFFCGTSWLLPPVFLFSFLAKSTSLQSPFARPNTSTSQTAVQAQPFCKAKFSPFARPSSTLCRVHLCQATLKSSSIADVSLPASGVPVPPPQSVENRTDSRAFGSGSTCAATLQWHVLAQCSFSKSNPHRRCIAGSTNKD